MPYVNISDAACLRNKLGCNGFKSKEVSELDGTYEIEYGGENISRLHIYADGTGNISVDYRNRLSPEEFRRFLWIIQPHLIPEKEKYGNINQ